MCMQSVGMTQGTWGMIFTLIGITLFSRRESCASEAYVALEKVTMLYVRLQQLFCLPVSDNPGAGGRTAAPLGHIICFGRCTDRFE